MDGNIATWSATVGVSSRGTRSPAPFIVGTGRSGTTLLRMMLDAHPELTILPETEFAAAFKAFEEGGATSAIEAIVDTPRWADFDIQADEFRARVTSRRPETFGDVARTLYELYAERMGKPRWGDKSPYYAGAVALIHEHIPEARFVHVIRDGRDVALSVMPLWFGPNDLAEAALWWSQTLEFAREQGKGVPFYKEVRFEALVRDPATTLKGVCEFIDLGWEPSMLEYHRGADRRLEAETANPLRIPDRLVSREERKDIHRFISHPPKRERVERWRREMSARDRRMFERIAGDMLEELGYEVGAA